MVQIADFVPHAPVPAEIIEEYRGRVPDELIEVWENYGYGTFGQGFIRLIDPKLYEAEVGDCIGKTQGDGIAIPFAVTGLGDLITWEPSHPGVIAIMYRIGDTKGQGSMKTFFNLVRRGGAAHLSDSYDWDIFPEAVAAHGELPYDQSFIFVPLLSLGGAAKVENLHKRETITAIKVAVDLQGVIGH
ncbi:GAD-like domain-containing protein [Microbacterium sp. CIAB417]|uniref:GAD-like domain-containing protein n=1 Tax=Microbacterium sp. CIAB417 TaxID=2860287 RepID=UPI001FACFE4A|nr:GAD-like domain-containing protein [Microbacterium sp. CIAB417]